MGVANDAEEMAIQEGVGVGVRFAQVEAGVLRESLQRASFGGSGDGLVLEIAGPAASFFGELRGADPRLNAQAASFELAFKSGGG